MNSISKIQKILNKKYPGIKANAKDDIVFLEGELKDYNSIVSCGKDVASTKLFTHVVNNITLKGYVRPKTKRSSINDKTLDKTEVDVLVIGGGVVGSAILRELSKYNLSCLLIDKEEDLAMHASSRNDGCIHVGIDLKKNSLKLHYLQRARTILPSLCSQLDIDYREDGQTIGFKSLLMKPIAAIYMNIKAKENKIKGIQVLNRKKLLSVEPNLADDIKFGVFMPSAACICPYNFTIALAESAVINGAKVSLNTIVEDMEVKNHEIISVKTNRGTIRPKVVVNAAGVFSDQIADMAEDKFFSIHPRKGTDTIMDKSMTPYLSKTGITIYATPQERKISHSKGGGIIPTIDRNILVGPDAVEQIEREDFSTDISSINTIFKKHHQTIDELNKRDIITYFSGIRAATYEEDFIVQKGKWTKNIVHAAGIQSPGLTAAPAIAEDIAKYAVEELGNVTRKDSFNPYRKGVVASRNLPLKKRDELIKKDPSYGHIVCRCEEISEGEIRACIHSLIPPTTVDGIKRRVRAGMGRCQGGFCQMLVTKILAEEENKDMLDICKKGEGKILFINTKEGENTNEK